jgi:hypothetical protein
LKILLVREAAMSKAATMWAVLVLCLFAANTGSQAQAPAPAVTANSPVSGGVGITVAALEALPTAFSPGQPINFLIQINNLGATVEGVNVGIFHGGRLVGWENGKTLSEGPNAFSIKDNDFKGDRGGYIVRVVHQGTVVAEREYATKVTKTGKYVLVAAGSGTPGRPGRPISGSATVVNLEAVPAIFADGQSISFLIRIDNRDSARQGFDIDVYHDGRLAGSEKNRTLSQGTNAIRVGSRAFRAQKGFYSVKLLLNGRTISEKNFIVRRVDTNRYTFDPA